MNQSNSSTKKQITVSFNSLTKKQEKSLGYKDKVTNIRIKNEDSKNETLERTRGLNLLGNLSFVPESGQKRKINCLEVNQPEKRIKLEEKPDNNSDNEEERVFNYMTGVYEPVKKTPLKSSKTNHKTQLEGKDIREELALTENGLHHPNQSRSSLLEVSNTPSVKRNLYISLTNEISSLSVSPKKESLVLSNTKDNSISYLNDSQESPSKKLHKSIDISPVKGEYFNHSNNSVNLSSEHSKLDYTLNVSPENGKHSKHSITSVHSPPDSLNLELTPDISPDNGERSDHSITAVNLPTEHLNVDDSNQSNSSVNTAQVDINLDDIPDDLSDSEHSNHSNNSVHSPPDSLNLELTPDILPDNGEHSNHSITAVNLPTEHLNVDDSNQSNSSVNTAQVDINLDDIPDVLSDSEHSNHSNNSLNLPPDTLEISPENEENSNHSITPVTSPPDDVNLDDTSDNEENSTHSITSGILPPEDLSLDDTSKESVLRDMLSNSTTKESYITSNRPFKALKSASEINLSVSNENTSDSIVFDDLPSDNSSSTHCLTSDANATLKDSISNINGSKTINVDATNLNNDKVLAEVHQDHVKNLSADNLEKQKSLSKWQCKTCGLAAGTKEKLISHLYNAHLKEDYEIKIKCKSCTFESSTPEEMKVHKLIHDKNDVRNKKATLVESCQNNTLLNYGFTLNCDSCKFKCHTLEEMTKHRSSGHNKNGQPKKTPMLKVKCNICKFECNTPKELEVHKSSHEKTACSNNTNSIISIGDSENDSDNDFDYRKSQRFRCFICHKYETDVEPNMLYHAGIHHEVEYNCEVHFWQKPLETCPKCIFEKLKNKANASLLSCKRCSYKTVRKFHFNRHKSDPSNCKRYNNRQKALKRSAQNINGLESDASTYEKLLEDPLLNIFRCCDCLLGFTRKEDLKTHALLKHPNSTYKCSLHTSKVNFIKCKKCIYELIFKKFDPKDLHEDRPVVKSKHLAAKETETNNSAYREPQEYSFTDSDSDSCEENETEVAVTRSRALGNKPSTNQTESVVPTSLENKSNTNQTETVLARLLGNNSNTYQAETVVARSLWNKSNINQTKTVVARSVLNKSNTNQTETVLARLLGNNSNTNQTKSVVSRSLGNNSIINPTEKIGLKQNLLVVTIINTVPSLNRLTETVNANIARRLTTNPDEVIVIDDSEENVCKSKDKNQREKELSAHCFDCKFSSVDRDQSFLDHVCRHIGSKYQCVKHSKKKLNDCSKCFYEETLENVRRNCKLCKKCGFVAADTLSLKRHEEQTNSCKEGGDQKLKSGEIKCFGCNYITTHKKFLKYHMVDHLSLIFTCDIHPNVQKELCQKCFNGKCLDEAKKEAKICKKCNFTTLIQQVFDKHNCKEMVDYSLVNVLEQNNCQQVIIDESEGNISVDKACDQTQKDSGKSIVTKSIVTKKSAEKVTLDNITMENTNSTIELINREVSETNTTDKTVLKDVDKAFSQTPVVGKIMVEEIRTEDGRSIIENVTDDPSAKIVVQSVKINDPSATINDPSVNIIDPSVNSNNPSVNLNNRSLKLNVQSVKINDQSVKTNDQSGYPNVQSVKINDHLVKINKASVDLNDPYVPNDQSVKINVLSVKINDQSVKLNDSPVDVNAPSITPNDQSVKVDDQSVNINKPSVDINEPFIKPNDHLVKINDQSVKINDPPVNVNAPSITSNNDQSLKINEPSVDINDPFIKPNDQFVKINDQSLKINEPSVDINDHSVTPNDQSVKINEISVDINDSSVKANDQSVKTSNQSLEINEISVDINDPSVKPNDQSVKINDQSLKINEISVVINDPSVKPDDQSVRINDDSVTLQDQPVKINEPSVKINDQTVKKYNCFDCDLFFTNSLDDLKKHATSQHKSSVFICKEHGSESDLNNCLKCIYEYSFWSQNKRREHKTKPMESAATRVSTLESGQNEKNTKIDPSQNNGSGKTIVNEEIKAKCYDCKFTAKKKGMQFKEHVSQHVGSKYQCLEHWRNKNLNCLKCYYEETLQTLNIEVKICRYCGYRAMSTIGLRTHLNNSGTCTRWANRKLEAGHIRCFKCFFVTSKTQYLKYHMIDHLNWIFSCDLHREKKNEGCEKCINAECLETAKKEAKICKKCNFKTVIKQVFKIHECIVKSDGSKGGFSGITPTLTPVFSMKVLPVSFVSSPTVDLTLVAKEDISSASSTQQTNDMDASVINNSKDVEQNKSVRTKESYQCFDCNFSHNEKKSLISHAATHVNSNFKCDEHEKPCAIRCDKCFYWQLLQDISRCNAIHTCYDCCPPKTFTENWSVRRHMKKLHQNSVYVCNIHNGLYLKCGKCYYQLMAQELKVDRKTNSTQQTDVMDAPITNNRNDSEDGEQNKSVMPKESYQCFDCNFSYNEKKSLISHAATHVNSNFKCDEHEKPCAIRCDKCFYWQLLQDISRCNAIHTCYDCCPPKTFTENWSVRRHMKKLHQNSVYVCNIHNGLYLKCGKCYYQLMAQELKVDRKTNSTQQTDVMDAPITNNRNDSEDGEQNKSVMPKESYQCFDCDFSHNEKSLWISHVLKHKNSKFKCDVHKIPRAERCDKCFYWKLLQKLPRLKRCYDCRPPKAFSHVKNIPRHIKLLHKESVYVCDIHDERNFRCGQCYYQSEVYKVSLTLLGSRCYDCHPSKMFAKKWHLTRHVYRCHKKSVYVCKIHNGQNDKCDNCLYQLTIRDVRVNRYYTCCDCNRFIHKEKEKLLNHIRNCHLNSNFRCNKHIPSENTPDCRKCIYVASVKEACKTNIQ